MPTLFRFIVILGLICGAIYGSMLGIVSFVEPKEREIIVRIPSERLNAVPQSQE